jgi:hypothetical protein
MIIIFRCGREWREETGKEEDNLLRRRLLDGASEELGEKKKPDTTKFLLDAQEKTDSDTFKTWKKEAYICLHREGRRVFGIFVDPYVRPCRLEYFYRPLPTCCGDSDLIDLSLILAAMEMWTSCTPRYEVSLLTNNQNVLKSILAPENLEEKKMRDVWAKWGVKSKCKVFLDFSMNFADPGVSCDEMIAAIHAFGVSVSGGGGGWVHTLYRGHPVQISIFSLSAFFQN